MKLEFFNFPSKITNARRRYASNEIDKLTHVPLFFLLTSGWISWIAINLQSVSLSSRKSYQLSFFSLLILNVCTFYGQQALFLLAIFSFLFMSVLLYFFFFHNINKKKKRHWQSCYLNLYEDWEESFWRQFKPKTTTRSVIFVRWT